MPKCTITIMKEQFKTGVFYVAAIIGTLIGLHYVGETINEKSTELFWVGMSLLVGLGLFWFWQILKLANYLQGKNTPKQGENKNGVEKTQP